MRQVPVEIYNNLIDALYGFKNFALADEIRDKLKEQGIILEDTPSGVKWRRG